MRTDLVVGVMVSIAFHGALLTARSRPPVAVASIPPPEEIIQIAMPPLPPEELEEEPVERLQEEASLQPAPPSLVDLPSPKPGDFEMPIQPPPPPGIPTGDLSQIPVARNYGPPSQGIPIFDRRHLDQQPTLTGPVAPVYPFDERRRGIEGRVTIEFVVTSSGRTANAHVVSSTHRAFEQPALDAVLRWQFRAGRKSGRAVNTRVQQVIDFSLNEN